MLKHFQIALAALLLLGGIHTTASAAEVGSIAPDFSATDINGAAFKLSDHKGEIVVLEWTNHLCPYVMKHYDSGNMQKTQKYARDNGVTWVSIVSSAPERQGHISPGEARTIIEEKGAHPSFKILDPSGTIGKAYDAKTTPHMFVINKEGTLVYNGAIDDNPSPRQSTIEGAENYVISALDHVLTGTPVEKAETQPYGCSVKYDY